MTFQEWRDNRYGLVNEETFLNLSDLQAAWDAATTAVNVRSGDSANEAEKDARRKVAIEKMTDWFGGQCLDAPLTFSEMLDAIIKKAQG
jgi:hypothetical protein